MALQIYIGKAATAGQLGDMAYKVIVDPVQSSDESVDSVLQTSSMAAGLYASIPGNFGGVAVSMLASGAALKSSLTVLRDDINSDASNTKIFGDICESIGNAAQYSAAALETNQATAAFAPIVEGIGNDAVLLNLAVNHYDYATEVGSFAWNYISGEISAFGSQLSATLSAAEQNIGAAWSATNSSLTGMLSSAQGYLNGAGTTKYITQFADNLSDSINTLQEVTNNTVPSAQNINESQPTPTSSVSLYTGTNTTPVTSSTVLYTSGQTTSFLTNIYGNESSQIENFDGKGGVLTTYYTGLNASGLIYKTDSENSDGTSTMVLDNADGSSETTRYSGPNGAGNIVETQTADSHGNVAVSVPDNQTYTVPVDGSSMIKTITLGNGAVLDLGSSQFQGLIVASGNIQINVPGLWNSYQPYTDAPFTILYNYNQSQQFTVYDISLVQTYPYDPSAPPGPGTGLANYVPATGSNDSSQGVTSIYLNVPVFVPNNGTTFELTPSESGGAPPAFPLDDFAEELNLATLSFPRDQASLVLNGSGTGQLTDDLHLVSLELRNGPNVSLSGGNIYSGSIQVDPGSTISGHGSILSGLTTSAQAAGVAVAPLAAAAGATALSGAEAEPAQGTVETAITDDGLISPNGGSLTLTGGLGGTGAIQIGPTGSLVLNGSINQSSGDKVTLAFNGVGGTFTINDTGSDTLYLQGNGSVDSGIIYGGSGVYTASFSVPMSQAEITYNPDGSVSISDPLDGTETFSHFSTAQFTDGSVSLLPEAPVCFAASTMILTHRGNLPVEALSIGDLVVTASGICQPIKWLGHRVVDCRRHPRSHETYPIRILPGTFGPGLPERDLWLSPGHPVLVGADEDGAGGHLVPIMCLINGTTVARVPVDSVTYWHVELDRHDILLAEGLPAESYLDWGDRAFFAEGADRALDNPDWVVPGLAGRCRPVALDGPVVEAERWRLDTLFAARLSGACHWPTSEAAWL